MIPSSPTRSRPPQPSGDAVAGGRPGRHRHLRALRTLLGVATLALPGSLVTTGCQPDPPEASSVAGDPPAAESEAAFPEQIFERNVVFLTTRTDSLILVPWLLEARTAPDGVERHTRGYLGRGSTWEAFYDQRWTSPPTHAPWRILPRGTMRILVGEGDALERIMFEEGTRKLHVALDGRLVEWGGQRGETFRLLDGALLLANQTLPGVVLDMSRGRRATDPPPGSWAVLASGDSLLTVVHSPVARRPGTAGAWRGWARQDFRELQWTALTMTWDEVRPFEPARRDVPARWTLASADGDVEATLEARAAEISAGEGAGPQLPVDALFRVAGTLRIQGREYVVRGFLRYVHPGTGPP